jgi:hypothetical protein
VSLAETPRGPVKFDDYGNLTFTVYIRKVEKRGGKFVNTRSRAIRTSVSSGTMTRRSFSNSLPFRGTSRR